MKKGMRTVAIILAAGQGKRMESKIAKQYLEINDRPILYYTLNAFQNSFIDEIILVVMEGETLFCQKEIVDKYQFTKVKTIIPGGKERYHSVYQGLLAAENASYVFIHDGARPFISKEVLAHSYEAVLEYGSCVVGVPVKDTIRIVDGNEFTAMTPNRNRVWAVQTPQVFEYEKIRNAYEELILKELEVLEQGISITDDAMVFELFSNEKVKMIFGSYENIKITTPEDLKIAKALLI